MDRLHQYNADVHFLDASAVIPTNSITDQLFELPAPLNNLSATGIGQESKAKLFLRHILFPGGSWP